MVGGCGWLVLGFAACACVLCLVFVCLLCGAESCRVSRVVARYFLFVVRPSSSVVDCPSLCCALLLCVAVSSCVVLERGRGGCMHRTRLRVHVQNVPVCTGTTPTCFIHMGVVLVHTGTL